MLVRDLGEGGTWYVVAVHYASALQAKNAWERANIKLTSKAGDEGVGVTRLAPNPEGNVIDSGAPEGAHIVVAVTLDHNTAARAERILRDGKPWLPTEDFADTMIKRRARILKEQLKVGRGGRLIIRRPEGRGAHLFTSGKIEESGPGQG